ncbi:undecaprenyldiphospho-muramoylpentapeptide beta-N-acetylglucosaminyltransferase [Vampirovibrio chlorellavorus]|uniref:undecaprenyldiphospho-muramoylpentapeptide beta-N-acetylglucosaminyltransferase n=1 Tax=Vampirovibrio chlorellavorus TaxID=758823 RepID=UPI0026EBC15F|nr:undecaprenyldiphospho-muramoylpentapeptide beta-N-acetylglucosaminyltransferase [Vampirovibrio chlorellavorus]
MRLVVTGGGTGGHIYPALAVAELMRNDPAVASVTYIGKTGGLESELVPQHGIEFLGISFYGMPRGKSPLLPFRLLVWLARLEQAKRKARMYLSEIKPHVVFGTGGYVSAPVLMAAHDLKIPYVVHEPDANPGLVNRLMGRQAAVITTSFTEGAELLRYRPTQEILVTGNPIRGSIGTLSRPEAQKLLGLDWPEDKKVLLVTGGSQGARRINLAVVEALPRLLDELGLAVIHITGKKLYDETMEALDALDPALKSHACYQVRPYSGEMAALLAVADVALCRAGSLSLSEMYVCGVPTILVPYPHAAADHQRKNAQASVRAEASVMIEDAECTGASLFQEISGLLKNPHRLLAMKSAAIGLGHPDATSQIVSGLKKIAHFP